MTCCCVSVLGWSPAVSTGLAIVPGAGTSPRGSRQTHTSACCPRDTLSLSGSLRLRSCPPPYPTRGGRAVVSCDHGRAVSGSRRLLPPEVQQEPPSPTTGGGRLLCVHPRDQRGDKLEGMIWLTGD